MTHRDDWLGDALMRGAGGLEEIEGGLDGNLAQWAEGRAIRQIGTPPPGGESPSWRDGQSRSSRRGRRGFLGRLLDLIG
ncbi:MAG: hypothetical protein J2P30_20575 [Actinobacteria bacterium]|nr:hypothetical protein [Actinomycetota bacterium]